MEIYIYKLEESEKEVTVLVVWDLQKKQGRSTWTYPGVKATKSSEFGEGEQ